jgi:hypothetical protein
MKFILGALAAVTLLVGVTASQPADAACYWNGYGRQCWHSHYYGYHPFYGYQPYYYGYQPYRHHYWRGY